jgi:Ca2+-binding RTX toxin-like protein
MATLSTDVALDMDNWNLGNIGDGRLGAHDGDHFAIHGVQQRVYDFGGHGFDYFGFARFSVPTAGEVQSLTIADAGTTVFTLTSISIDVPKLYGFLATDQFDALETYLFRNDDTIKGSGYDDVLRGFTGDDTLSGARGADSLNGGFGADRLAGGAGHDAFVFSSALDSTSVLYDRLTDFDASKDIFVFDRAVTAVDTNIVGGHLTDWRFDVNLANAADGHHLGADHAVLFAPDAGKHAGETFLIVDLNGTAGYQIGEDAVIRLDDTSHLAGLSAANFAT